jgi:GT2 family glycosyltransferase
VINYDGGEVTWRCLEALARLNYPKDRYEVVLVDNASIDGLVWRCRSDERALANLRVIESLTNEGFARGNNLALNDLKGVDLVGLINNDAFPDPNWLDELVRAVYSATDVGAVTSKILFNQQVVGLELRSNSANVCISGVRLNGQDVTSAISPDERFINPAPHHRPNRAEYWFAQPASFTLRVDELSFPLDLAVRLSAVTPSLVTVRSPEFTECVTATSTDSWFEFRLSDPMEVVNSAGGGLFNGFQGGDIGFRELDVGQFESRAEVFSFCGGAVLLRSEFLSEVGLFDPSYFLYYEDLDLSWRGRLAGWRILYEPRAVAWHEHAYSSKEGSAFFRFWVDRNRRLTLIKNAPTDVAIKAFIGAIVWGLRDAIVPVMRAGARGRKPPLRNSIHRLRQLGSFLRATPGAYFYRRRQFKVRQVRPDFVYHWVSTRFDNHDAKR